MSKMTGHECFENFIVELGLINYYDSTPGYDGKEVYLFCLPSKSNIESFTFLQNSGLVNATYKNRQISKRFISLEDLIDLYKIKIFGKKDSEIENSPFGDLLKELDMVYGAGQKHGFNVLGWRPAMSYLDGFKYNDIFEPANKVALLIRKNQDLIKINKCWQYKKDPDILLVSSPGFNFLITVQDLADSLDLGLDEVARWLPII